MTEEDKSVSQANGKDEGASVKPLNDAVDYGDIEEVVPDDLEKNADRGYQLLEQWKRQTFESQAPLPQPDRNASPAPEDPLRLVKEAFPSFRKHEVPKFSELFTLPLPAAGAQKGPDSRKVKFPRCKH